MSLLLNHKCIIIFCEIFDRLWSSTYNNIQLTMQKWSANISHLTKFIPYRQFSTDREVLMILAHALNTSGWECIQYEINLAGSSRPRAGHMDIWLTYAQRKVSYTYETHVLNIRQIYRWIEQEFCTPFAPVGFFLYIQRKMKITVL